MDAAQAFSVAVCVGQLALALVGIARAARSPLAVPLALLCLDVAGWTGASLAYQLSGVGAFHWLDHALVPWTAPLALQFILVFVGRRRALRGTVYAAALVGGVLSAIGLLALAFPVAQGFIASPWWARSLMGAAIPTMVLALAALARHLRDSLDPEERARAWLLLAAFAVGTALGATEELTSTLFYGNLGLFVSTGLLAFVAARFRLITREISLGILAAVLALTAAGVVATVLVFRYLGANAATVVLSSAAVSLAVVAASRRWLAADADRRARQSQLATLGRFSAQMAHDLKNPLAALKGAAQLLREDLARPTGVDRVAFADLMVDQIDRLDRLVDVYGRLARVEPARDPLDLNEMARAVLALQSLAREKVAVKVELADGELRCRADREMLSRVLENLVRNAMEAMSDGGTVTVRTARSGAEGRENVTLSVADTGSGMDARIRERAFDDFFTTKARGSGLGLAFVQRVVEAHGGSVSLESEVGRGTVVEVRLPAGPSGLRETVSRDPRD
ncbi:MAG TPA: ATP-binding protein [Polyangiaceae bacterium]|jgi:signal transduction histidine kinase